MSKSKKAFDELNIVMTQALLQMQTLVENDVTKESDFTSMASLFLIGLMSTAADISELMTPNSGTHLYSEVEAAAKNGGFRNIHNAMGKGGNHYSVSDIAPDDATTAMNYLGQELGATLFKHIHDLPKPLRTPEMLLRGVEALVTNLLHQKFNTPENPHAILDSLCEHVHMALNGLDKRPKLRIIK